MNRSDFSGPSISILIRVFNSQKTLPLVLGKLTGKLPSSRIICVDSGSSDNTLSIIGGFGCRLVKLKGPFSYSRALNVGFEVADTDWVICLSSHCIPVSDEYVGNYARTFSRAESSVTCVAGAASMLKKIVPCADEELVVHGDGMELFLGLYSGNSNCAYRRSAWQQRRFDESLNYGEDWHWCVDAVGRGEKLIFSGSVPVAYRHTGGVWCCFMKGFTGGREDMIVPKSIPRRSVHVDVPKSVYSTRIALWAGARAGRFWGTMLNRFSCRS
ncbi:glycosyltransferase family 2 protein [Rariglobus hedericola]|uniref:Glycosyltransferase family 2 protein n=1 Tax=Rariglobus hedericola TaxID=2597822 RepID=A0A556QQP2_9BACT|nr:glycosyltransferase family 2 protein [Rariglobus hedericola]TSJ78955.1 glycosyltransferase family 2 protein [Rariglobus hedericola]